MKLIMQSVLILTALIGALLGCSSGTEPNIPSSTQSAIENTPVIEGTATEVAITTEVAQSDEEINQNSNIPPSTPTSPTSVPLPTATTEVQELVEQATSNLAIIPSTSVEGSEFQSSEIQVPGNRILAMSFAKSEELVAVAGPSGIALFNANTLLPIESFQSPTDMEKSFCLHFSPDESLLASSPGKILVINSTTGEPLYELAGPSDRKCFLWIPNTNRIINPGGNSLNEFERDSLRREYKSTLIPSTSLNYAATSPNGTMLAAFDPFDNYISYWNTETGEMMGYYQPDLGDFSSVTQLAWSPDSSYFAILEWKKLTIYNASDWQVVSVLESLDQTGWGDGATPGFYRMAFSPSGERLAVGSEGSMLVWNWKDDLVEGFVFLTSDGSEPVGSWDNLNSTNIGETLAIDWFSDGHRIVAAARKGIVIWDLNNSTVFRGMVANFTEYTE